MEGRSAGATPVIAGDPFFNGVQPTGARHKLEDVRLLAPIIPRSKVIGIGRNYAEHIKEMGNETPAAPLMFLKPNTSVIGPNEPLVLPEFSDEISYEAELCVIIGRICKDVPVERVDDVIFGYTCGNDLTARDAQRTDNQWARAKGAVAGLPGDLGEGVHVRPQPLVALGDAGETLDRAPVEPGPVLDRTLELVERDGHRLDDAEDIGELELHEADVVLLGRFDLG